jgi:hypothetical protein
MYMIFKPNDIILHHEYKSQNLSFHVIGAVETLFGKGIYTKVKRKGNNQEFSFCPERVNFKGILYMATFRFTDILGLMILFFPPQIAWL